MTEPPIAIVEGGERPPKWRFNTCANCDHFAGTEFGECCVRAPQIIATVLDEEAGPIEMPTPREQRILRATRFPRVRRDAWCGEHSRATDWVSPC